MISPVKRILVLFDSTERRPVQNEEDFENTDAGGKKTVGAGEECLGEDLDKETIGDRTYSRSHRATRHVISVQ